MTFPASRWTTAAELVGNGMMFLVAAAGCDIGALEYAFRALLPLMSR